MQGIKKMDLKNKELGKLVEYAFHLREGEYQIASFPTYEFYEGCGMVYGVKTENGGVSVYQSYPDHSTCSLLTALCVFEGENKNPRKAYFISTTSEEQELWIETVKLTPNGFHFTCDNDFYCMSKKDVIDSFLDAMKMLGFREEDIIRVLEKKMTGQEAFRNVAGEEIKNRTWVYKDRKQFVFDGNVAIEGDFGGMCLEEFPFPFEETPIFDSSKVTYACAKFENNSRGITLININQNKNSIYFTDLRNVKIDEVIDLSRVDATCTTFGHHKVINLEVSIVPLNTMNLTLATDLDGNNYITDSNGVVNSCFLAEDIMNRNARKIQVYANADNRDMAIDAVTSNADGIGLIRTEDIFTGKKKALMNFSSYADCLDSFNLDTEFNHMQEEQLKEICRVAPNSKMIVRLFDFKEDDFKRMVGEEWESSEQVERKGFLRDCTGVLRDQIFTIAKVSKEEGVSFDILVPMVTDSKYFTNVKRNILSYASDAGMKDVKIGAMIENLEGVKDADNIAKNADFISIGTNDLTEDITGKKRNVHDQEFFYLTDEVKACIEDVIYRAKASNPGVKIGICGEHANYLENVMYYGTLNVDYVTCSSSFVEVNKKILNPVQKVKK